MANNKNLKHLIPIEMLGPMKKPSSQHILRVLKREKPFLRREYGVASIALFGSALRDQLTDDSDIDILVSMDPGKNQNLLDLMMYLEHLLGRKVDIAVQQQLKPILKPYIEESAHHV